MGDGAGDSVRDRPDDAGDERRAAPQRGTGASRGRRLSRPPRVALILIAVFVVVYALVVTLYAFSGRVTAASSKEPEAEPGGVTVVLTVESVNAAQQTASLSMRIDPSNTLYSGDGLSVDTDISVVVTPVRGSQAVTFAAGSAPETKDITLSTAGEIENWPFDAYRADRMLVLAYVTSGDVSRPIPTSVWFTGYVPGWSVDVAQHGPALSSTPKTLSEALDTSPTILFTATRSGSTVAFAFVLLALLVAMPCLVLFVAITAFRGRRKLEPSFMGWMGAMLFATIPLRSFLPGSPPIGSWIDFTVVLWVVVGLITGLVIYVAAWARSSRPESPPPPPDA